jgi:hypothetical protein
MAGYFKKCERCGIKVFTRDWWDDEYNEINPFLCHKCVLKKIRNNQPERLSEKTRRGYDSLNHDNK